MNETRFTASSFVCTSPEKGVQNILGVPVEDEKASTHDDGINDANNHRELIMVGQVSETMLLGTGTNGNQREGAAEWKPRNGLHNPTVSSTTITVDDDRLTEEVLRDLGLVQNGPSAFYVEPQILVSCDKENAEREGLSNSSLSIPPGFPQYRSSQKLHLALFLKRYLQWEELVKTSQRISAIVMTLLVKNLILTMMKLRKLGRWASNWVYLQPMMPLQSRLSWKKLRKEEKQEEVVKEEEIEKTKAGQGSLR